MSLSDLSAAPRTALRRHRDRGRTERDDLPTARELAATSVLELPLTEASVRIRDGEPEPDTALRPGISAPPHIRRC